MSAIRDGLEDACKETIEFVVAHMRKRVAEERRRGAYPEGASYGPAETKLAETLIVEIERGDFWPPGEPDFT